MLTKEQLDKYWNVAVRDDACEMLVPSDIRMLVGECQRRGAALAQIADIADGSGTVNSLPHIAKIAREAQ